MLTIYIPTYNRVKHLRLLLSSLFEELDNNPSISAKILIKIFNNNSSDETSDFLNSISRSNIFVCNREKNIGSCANVADAVNHCDTEFLWILGDDDIPHGGILGQLIDFFKNNKPDLLYLPPVWRRDIFEIPVPSVSDGIGIQKLSAEKFSKQVGATLTFISSFVFSFRYYSAFKSANHISYAAATDFPHLAFFSPAILSGKALYVVDEVVINATGNSKFQYSLIEAFGIDLPNIFQKIFGINQRLVDGFIVNLLVAFLPSFLYSIKFGSSKSLDSSIPWKDLRDTLGNYKVYWIFIYPIKFLPKFIALPLVVAGRLLR